MNYCHACLKIYQEKEKPGFRDICPNCRADLHVCLNCKFYDTSKSNQCFANVEEPVIYKDRSNFCEEFIFIDRPAPHAKISEPVKAKESFEKLFKKK